MPDDAQPSLRGVAFTAPPVAHLPSIRAALDQAIATLPPNRQIALISVLNERGANAAVVGRLEGGWEVYGYIGKEWAGSLQYGAAVRWSY